MGKINPRPGPLLNVRADSAIHVDRGQRKPLVRTAGVDRKRFEFEGLNDFPGRPAQRIDIPVRAPAFAEIGDAENLFQTLLDLRNLRGGSKVQEESARNAPCLPDLAAGQRRIDVPEQAVFEIVPVTLLQGQLTVVNDDQAAHR